MKKRLLQLLSEMTLKEKLAQMTQLMGDCYIEEDFGQLMGLTYGFEVTEELVDGLGSVLGMSGAKKLRDVQDKYLKKSRLKIPLLFMADVIHGYKTIFPSPLALACTWDEELVTETARISAVESAVSGLHVTFSPMADLARDARWGRVIEGFGEDPLLNKIFTRAFVNGYQGKDVKEKFRMAACVKHFAAYGAAEGGRDYNTTEVGKYSLEENYLPAYKEAIDAGCKLVMSSFNSLGGTPVTGSESMMRGVLRDQWGFDGVLISDCTAVCELIPHGFAENPADATRLAIRAGVDIEMVSNFYWNNVESLLADGSLDMQLLDEAVLRILKLKDELGLFENPYKDADELAEKELLLCDAHRQIAYEAAVESFVLLKNDNALPICVSDSGKIALIGPHANEKLHLDVWKAEGSEEDCTSVYDAFCDGVKDKDTVYTAVGCSFEDSSPDEHIEMAEALAKDCDTVILLLGEPPEMSSEAGSRAYLNLPGRQMELVDRIHKLGKKTIAVVFAGRPLELKELSEKVDAILYVWFPGTEGGQAIADMLTGKVSPSGRLTMSFPYTVGQMPLYYNMLPTGRPQRNHDNAERFVSRYLDAPNEPIYPFGYGLTYTKFAYENESLSSHEMSVDGKVITSVKVTNVGETPGTEVVQLYIRDVAGSYSRPIRELKAFKKIILSPNESAVITFEITGDMLAFHGRNGYNVETGLFNVFLASDAHSGNALEFVLV